MAEIKAKDGGLIATSTAHRAEDISSVEQLESVLDELADLSRNSDIGQMIELRVDIDEVLVVAIDEPRHGWGLAYDNSVSGVSLVSVDGSGDASTVALRWAENWEEMEVQCFIDRTVARQAVLDFYRTRTLSDDVIWAV